eukprot:CAMPEP_0194747380 /NCGR_PEP_ID=MMETSP0323_2-20130528/1479_1 /TAXON_ID=2866 ORGANISM="Crypthecodinium cohnii, Strain Seligo" /NCGR_SAMPLE_ID=MMETSP0323_2 /ASSEMBLY_ACC=CAM_ASM_000346 /LENGTH=50 /DNA_ID=CAMNT_0039660697 /DNA_START=164 /DNA_END=313 /DNA_ORIENTATION=+
MTTSTTTQHFGAAATVSVGVCLELARWAGQNRQTREVESLGFCSCNLASG